MTTYAIVYFVGFSPYWEKNHYSFECVTRTPEIFETISVPTREGIFEGIVVGITTEPEYPVGVYKI